MVHYHKINQVGGLNKKKLMIIFIYPEYHLIKFIWHPPSPKKAFIK